MKISQKVWSLYNSMFQYIDDRLKKDPELILPEVLQSLVRSGDSYEFKFKGVPYRLECRKGKDETDRIDDSTMTPMTFVLKVNGNLVYEFEMRRTVVYGPDSPSFYESFGNILAFIEGPWTTDVDELQGAMRGHSQQIYKQRNAPKVAAQLQQDMKKCGL